MKFGNPLAEAIRDVGDNAFAPLADFSKYGRLVEPEPIEEPARPRQRGQRHVTMSRDETGLHAEVRTDDGSMRTVQMRRGTDGEIIADVIDED